MIRLNQLILSPSLQSQESELVTITGAKLLWRKQNLKYSDYDLFIMIGQQKKKIPFVQQMDARLLQYELQKLKRLQLQSQCTGQKYQKQHNAKQALIDMGNDSDASKLIEDDIFIGRWSYYKVPEKVQQRYSLNIHDKKHNPPTSSDFKTITDKQKTPYPINCKSQKVIPKLKCILHQLEAPLHLLPGFKGDPKANLAPKMKNHFGVQALVISNKEEIKPSAKTQRKRFFCSDIYNEGENRRPLTNSSHKKAIPNAYQKIKRPTSKNKDCDLICEKQILSQLIKGNCKPSSEVTPLRNMLDYFTMSHNDNKRKAENILSLNRLLS